MSNPYQQALGRTLIDRTIRERIVLVGVIFDGHDESETEESLDELAQLIDTAGAVEVARMTQRRDSPDSTFFIGKGKAQELKELCLAVDSDTVVFDNELTPGQQYNLEKLLGRTAIDRTGNANPVPLVSGPIRRVAPIEAQDAAFLRRHSTKPVKLTLPGPFTMTQQAENAYYPDLRSLAMDYADAVNAEVKDLFAAGVDVVQLDEPYLQARADEAKPPRRRNQRFSPTHAASIVRIAKAISA